MFNKIKSKYLRNVVGGAGSGVTVVTGPNGGIFIEFEDTLVALPDGYTVGEIIVENNTLTIFLLDGSGAKKGKLFAEV